MVQSNIENADEISACKLTSQQVGSKLNSDNQREINTNEAVELQVKTETARVRIKNDAEDNMDIHNAELDTDNKPQGLPRLFKHRQSTIGTRKQQAVCVRDAHKHYGSKKDPAVILDGLNMTVPKGIIYGLLGASGCGKTTLLSCIVGRRLLNSGEIWVLGGKPGSKGSGVPGPRIGYMPQETALYSEFTIRETLHYFGWIAGMSGKKIDERLDYLMQLLLLPNPDQLVRDLSGGQQRRVSLAAALLHEPELLILDEPTVGLDPVLRESIWNHFVHITRDESTTIIITTHYIDETRQADLIALMRGGYFLAEESPETLLTYFGAQSLEEVFLKLSVKQTIDYQQGDQDAIRTIADPSGEVTTANTSTGAVNRTFVVDDIDIDISGGGKFGDNISLSSRRSSRRVSVLSAISNIPLPSMPVEKKRGFEISSCCGFNINHMKALLWKNFLWMWRNIPVMIAILIFPFIQSALFCICIGSDPANLVVAYVNYEANNVMNCNTAITCNKTQLGCYYLKYLEKHELILAPYDTEESARNSVLKGKTYASVVFGKNYSLALQQRLKNWQESKNWDIEASEIDVFRDISNKLVANFLKVILYESYVEFLKDYLASCDSDSNWVTLPVKLEKPVYGENYPKFTDFVAPGLLLSFTCFLAVGLTALTMLVERMEGSLDRCLVIGVSEVELLASHAICQFIVMTMQSIISMVSLFAVFNLTMNGSITLVVILTLLTGFCGMCIGFVISCVCDNVSTAFYAAAGSFMPLVVLGGIIWPIEGMHPYLRPIMFILPLTHATEGLRSIMQRDWGLSEVGVYAGFITMSIWIIIFLALSVLFLKYKRDWQRK